MGKIIAFQISFLVVFLPSYFYFSKPKGGAVLAEKATASPTIIPSPTTTPTPTPIQTPDPTDTPKPTIKATIAPIVTPVPVPQHTSQQVSELIERFSGQYAVDPNVMRAIAICETSFNYQAINGPYWGLYQFGPTTWENLRKQMGEDPNTDLRLNPEEAAQTAAYAVSQGKRGIWPNCNP